MDERCSHGLPAADCLICKALGTGPTDKASPVGTTTSSRRGRRGPDLGATPIEVIAPGQPRSGGRSRSLGTDLMFIFLAVVVFMFAGWFVIGAIRGILHLVELIIVAIVAGWLGYRFGHFRGRREGR